MPGKPDAVFAVNDPVALGALSWLKGAGLSVPQNLGLVGFSNNSVTELMEPALTTVEQPARELGVSAAELLLNQLRHRDSSSIIPVTKVLETRLVVRGSA